MMKGGYFIFTVRDKRTGKIKSVERFKNGVTDFAKDLMLVSALTGNWFVGLIRTFDAVDPNLRIPPFDPIELNILGWQEYEKYTDDRKLWVATVTDGVATSSVPSATFQGFNEAMTFGMKGAFLAQTSTKGEDYDQVFAFSTGGSIVTLDDFLEVDYVITL